METFILLVYNDLTLWKTKINVFYEVFMTDFDYVFMQESE